MATAKTSEAFTDYKQASSKLPKEYHDIILKLRQELQKTNATTYVEYVGSAFKGTRIDASDMDNLFVKRDKTITFTKSRDKARAAYAFLFQGNGQKILPSKTLQTFKGNVQKILNASGYSDTTIVADHGPAIELRYFNGGSRNGGKPTFSVDLVFCYEIPHSDGSYKMYTAKPPKDASGEETGLWKRSTALEEKAMMSKIDKNDTIIRWIVRFLKSVKDREPTLQVLTSYIFEQAMFHLQGDHEISFWKEENKKQIIREVLTFVGKAVRREDLRNYFNSDENVLPQMTPITKENVANRLDKLSKDHQLENIVDENEEKETPTKMALPDYKPVTTGNPSQEQHGLILKLRDELKKNKAVSRIEYVESAASDMNILFIKRDKAIHRVPSKNSARKSYALLCKDDGQKILPNHTLQTFKGNIHKILNDMGYAQKAILADNYPAVELRYFSQGWNQGGNPTFTIRLVCCYEVPDSDVKGDYKLFEAKPPKDASGEETALWSRSTALEEKALMSEIDKNNTVRKWVVKFLKGVQEREAPLKVLRLGVFEQAIYYLHHDIQDKSFWKENNRKEIVSAILKFVADALRRGKLLNYFNREEDVLPSLNPATVDNVAKRLDRLSEDPLLQRLMAHV